MDRLWDRGRARAHRAWKLHYGPERGGLFGQLEEDLRKVEPQRWSLKVGLVTNLGHVEARA